MFDDDDRPTLNDTFNGLSGARREDETPAERDALTLALAAASSDRQELVVALLDEAARRCPDANHVAQWASWAVHNDRPLMLQALVDHHGLDLVGTMAPQGEPLFAQAAREGGPGVAGVFDRAAIDPTTRWTVPPHHHQAGGLPEAPMNVVSWMILCPWTAHQGRVHAWLDRPAVQQDQALLDHALRCLPEAWRGPTRDTWLLPLAHRLLDLGANPLVLWPERPEPSHGHPGVSEDVLFLTGDSAIDAQVLGPGGRAAVTGEAFNAWDREHRAMAHRDSLGWTTAHALAERMGGGDQLFRSHLAAALGARIDWRAAPEDHFGRSPLAVALQAHSRSLVTLNHVSLDEPEEPEWANPYALRDGVTPEAPEEEPFADKAPPATPALVAMAQNGWTSNSLGWDPVRIAFSHGLRRGEWALFDALDAHAGADAVVEGRLPLVAALGLVTDWMTALPERWRLRRWTTHGAFQQEEHAFSAELQHLTRMLRWTAPDVRRAVAPTIEAVRDEVIRRTMHRPSFVTNPMTRDEDRPHARLTTALAQMRERLILESELLRLEGPLDVARPRARL